jgi:hypothetical protein
MGADLLYREGCEAADAMGVAAAASCDIGLASLDQLAGPLSFYGFVRSSSSVVPFLSASRLSAK